MNTLLLRPEVQDFIAKHWDTDLMTVLLKKPLFAGISQRELAEQLEAQKKCRHKLPTWFATPGLYYPPKRHIEQTSSEKMAQYKARLISGQTLLDITGGLGVDAYFFSKRVDRISHCEIHQALSEIARHNFSVLGRENIMCFATDGIKHLQKKTQTFDWVYADPSRRNEQARRVFRLEDSLPNIPKQLPILFEKTRNILVKAAPLLDISQGIRALCFVKEVHVVALHNEVKELLFVLERGYTGAVTVKAVNIVNDEEYIFAFTPCEEQKIVPTYSEAKKYLYEPNAAILKSGGFKSVGTAFGLAKLHPHSHLYTADRLVDFPGRRFSILSVSRYSKAAMQALSLSQANLSVRNFPLSVAELRKKHKIKDGGTDYLFFTTTMHRQLIFLHCAGL